MRLQALSIVALLLQGAALALARSPISVRRPAGDDDADDDDTSTSAVDPNVVTTNGARVLLISPTSLSNSTATLNTCDSVYLWWFYDPQYTAQLDDTFNLTITNVGVDQNPPPPSSTTSTTTTTSGISSASNPGTLPTTTGPPAATLPTTTETTVPSAAPARLFRRADVTEQLVHDQAVVVANHYFFWPAINVPAGYYILTAQSTTGSAIPYLQSSAFKIGQGSTACFSSAGGAGGVTQVSSGSDAAQTSPPTQVDTASPHSSKTGIIVGAVVGTLLGLLAVGGLFFLFAFRRRQQQRGGSAWGQVGSSDSRTPIRAIGMPVGVTKREAAGRDSIEEEKYMGGVSRSGSASTGGHSTSFTPEPPTFRRLSQTSQAYPLGMLSTRDSRRSTIQSIPSTVTPTNASPLHSPSPVPAPGAALSRSTSIGGNGPKKTPRKPVPAYDPAEMSRETLTGTAGGSTPPKRNSTDAAVDDTDPGVQLLSSSQRTETSLLSAFPFEMDGARGQVHYLIPDPPVSPRR